jgi:hypothetical protein
MTKFATFGALSECGFKDSSLFTSKVGGLRVKLLVRWRLLLEFLIDFKVLLDNHHLIHSGIIGLILFLLIVLNCSS